jgi:dUTP pyrophosphatase
MKKKILLQDLRGKLMTRKFEYVDDALSKTQAKTNGIPLPQRGTRGSAGYDFCSPIEFEIAPGERKLVWTDIKAKMPYYQVLKMYVRSSIGIKKNLVLQNVTGIIDSDYYNNPSNDGNIGIMLWNTGSSIQKIEVGEKIAQGIFEQYYVVDDDVVAGDLRVGGIGSTGK